MSMEMWECSAPFFDNALFLAFCCCLVKSFKEGLMGKILLRHCLGVMLLPCVFVCVFLSDLIEKEGFSAVNENDYHPLTKHHVRGIQLLLLISQF